MTDAATVLAVLVVLIAMPLNWYVTVKLWRLSLASPELRVLRERAIVALTLALIVTVFAAIFVNNEVPTPVLNTEATRFITRSALLALSIIPAVYWLRLWQVRGTAAITEPLIPLVDDESEVRRELRHAMVNKATADVADYYAQHPDWLGDERSDHAIEAMQAGLKRVVALLDGYEIRRKGDKA